ncbi:glycoside hydrolase [Aureobasidium pullulans]|uniref:Glycoside hydrolase n=1 Tax=Aureobasidium pullulans TaxID=5580 RepID=A0A4S8SIY2_AURPU|nr:glycoside hydrolase [Aureobasidium pullulans]
MIINSCLPMARLPDEILLEIARHLSDKYDERSSRDEDDVKEIKHTLIDLCMTSMLFRTVAQPALHYYFDRTSDDLNPYDGSDLLPATHDREFRRCTRTENFIKTLIHRSDLAASVKSMKLDAFQDNDQTYSLNTTHLPLDPVTTDLLVGSTHRIPPPPPELVRQWASRDDDLDRIEVWQDYWREGLRLGFANAEIALLFTLVPNLMRLELSSSDADFGIIVHDLCEQMLGPRSSKTIVYRHLDLEVDTGFRSQSPTTPLGIFPNLRDLVLKTNPSKDLRFEGIGRLLSVSTLQSLQCEHVNGQDSVVEWVELPLSHLERLELQECPFDMLSLGALISSSKGLKHLQITLTDTYPDEDFWTALKERAATLETLQLHINFGEAVWDETQICDLSAFEKLRSMEIFRVMLSPAFEDSLPTSLEVLTISRCDEPCPAQIEQLLHSIKAGRLPELKEMNIAMDHRNVEFSAHLDERLLGLQSCFSEAGVRFQYGACVGYACATSD